MKTSPLKQTLIACASLLAGFALAGLVFSRDDGANEEGARANSSGSTKVLRAATTGGGAGSGAEAEPTEVPEHLPMDAARIVAFAREFDAIEDGPARVEAVLAWFESFGAEDFDPFVQQLFAMVDGEEAGDSERYGEDEIGYIENFVEWAFGDNEIVGAYFCECWATAAPGSLMASLQSLPPEKAVSLGTYALPYLWAHDPQGGREALEKLRLRYPEEFEDEFEEDEFVHNLYQVSEVAAVRWMIENGSENMSFDDLLGNGISDAHGVLQELFKFPDPDLREEALASFFDYYELADPATAVDLLRQYASEFEGRHRAEVEDWASELMATRWVMADPAARLDLNSGDYDASEIIREWLVDDHEAAWAWAVTKGDESIAFEEFTRVITEQFAELPFDFAIGIAEPHNIADWAAALSDEQLHRLMEKAPEEGISELYRRDPDAALRLAANPEGVLFQGLVEAIEDSDTRRQLFADLNGYARVVLGDQLFGSWAADDPAAAFEASAGHPRASASTTVVNQWLQFEDVENVYAAVGARLNGDMQNAIIDAWAIRDPWTAGETLLADGHGEGIPRLIEQWVGSDSLEASHFIREYLEPGDGRDQAVQELAQGIANRDPEAAHEWAESIANETLRASVIKELEAARP